MAYPSGKFSVVRSMTSLHSTDPHLCLALGNATDPGPPVLVLNAMGKPGLSFFFALSSDRFRDLHEQSMQHSV
jgi:hypothetical protein